MHRNLTNLALVFGLLWVITACVCPAGRGGEVSDPDTRGPANEKGSAPPKSGPVTKNKDSGDFTVEHVAVTNAKYAELDRAVRQEKLLENAAAQLNQALILPYNIVLRTKDCGEVNAFYQSDDHSVTVCYELMEHFFKIFKSAGLSDNEANQKMLDAIRFAFLHEIGHALIDTYKLPVMGNEEDAADRCSAYVNLEELGPEGVNAVLAAADAFNIESKMVAQDKRNLADEHLLQEQRFYNSLCMTYGSNTSKYGYLVSKGYLPKARADRCESEYARTVDSWKNLLAPWRKK